MDLAQREIIDLGHLANATTILVMNFEETGIIIGCDSRTTYGEYIMSDVTDKMFEITPNKVVVGAGIVDVLDKMREHVEKKVKSRLEKAKPLSVHKAAEFAFDNLVPNYSRGLGGADILVAGWDETLGRYDAWNARSHPPASLTSVKQYKTCGTGSDLALDVLMTDYKPNMSLHDARELAIKALFHAGFCDRFSGGEKNVFHVKKDRYEHIYSSDALTVYYDYFDLYPIHETVLFLLIPRHGPHGEYWPFLVSELLDYFRKECGVEAEAAHCVAVKKHFSFHRLVVNSDEEVSKVYEKVQDIGPLPKSPEVEALGDANTGSSEFFNNFTKGVYYRKEIRARPIYVEKKSRQLLQEIRNME